MSRRLDSDRYWLAFPAGGALAVGLLTLLSWTITPCAAREVRDNRVVLNLIAWPTPPVVQTTTPELSVAVAPPTVKPAPTKPRPHVARAPTPPPVSKPEVTVPAPPSMVVPAATLPSVTTTADTVVALSTAENQDPTLTPVPVFELTALPRFIRQVQPSFPESMRHLAREGVVELNVLIEHTGAVRQVTIVRSAGSEFDRAARSAILASAFAPGEVDGKPVTTVLHLPVRFRLQ